MVAPRDAAGFPPSLCLADVRAALRDTLPSTGNHCDGRAAAVAAVLRECDGQVELLFIRRASRRGDPWSGHMAWPGGKREPCDTSLLACAIRETREEIGLDLAATADLIGTVRAWRHKGSGPRPRGLQGVFPYVFALRPDVAPGVGAATPPTRDEVQEVVWIPLAYFSAWRSRRPWAWLARWLPLVPPAYRYEGRLVWGLTQWMLADLLTRLAAPAARPHGVPTAVDGARDFRVS
jgi:8-oxo-dGTP pyrophosphatase MutT (NUDIX family)